MPASSLSQVLLLILLAISCSVSAANLSQDLPSEWTTPKQAGDKVPDVTFVTRTRTKDDFEWKDVTTADLFANKRVIVFALPGAFTPLCSSTHLPGYDAKYEEILQHGVDDVYCLSVNDAFVMRQWGLHQGLQEDTTPGALGFTKVKLIPDGAAAFTRGMGLSSIWSSERGFGERSWRYSMVVNNGVIEKIFIEQPYIQNSGPDPMDVSDVDSMLAYLKAKEKDEL